MVLGLLLRDAEERRLAFDFEMLLPEDGDDRMDGGEGRNGAVVGVNGATFGHQGAKKDFKRGTVVCRHWLRALCMKGDNCEFLHQYDMSKMPECRWGMECQVPECPFRHVPDEERVECAFYKQGFCSHGSSCRYRHIKLAREECPETADFALQAKVADEENVKRRKAQPVNEFFKIAICKHWEKMGSCPFGDECHFAHGQTELRPFPKGEKEEQAARGGRHGGDHPGRGAPSFSGGERHQPPQGPQLPDEGKMAKYVLVQSASYLNLAHAVHFGKWAVPAEVLQQVKMASETADEVFLFFSVGPSKHFQGVARLVSGTMANVDTSAGEDLATGIVPYEADGKTEWSGAFGVEWLRICECPWERLAQFENKILDVPQCPNGHELDAETGHALMRLLFNQAKIQLHYRSVEDEPKLYGGAEELATRRREAAESLAGGPAGPGPGFGGPPQRWRATQPGFVFTCTSQTIDECFGRLLFGLAKEQEALAQQHVTPGTPLFLLNLSDQHLLGIFEAVSPAVVDMMPGAFCTGPNMPSPLPIQARFAVMLNAPALPTSDPQIKQVIGENGVDVGPLSLQVTQQLADVFAERSGGGFPPNGPPMGPGGPERSFRGKPSGPRSAGPVGQDGPKDTSEQPFLEKLVVGIENESDFGVTRRIIGPAGSNMKRISVEAGGNAKIRVRGRGSGSKEGGPEDADEPLMILVSADNERSFRIACSLTGDLLAAIHRDYEMFQQRGPQHFRGGGGGYRGRGHH
ncbi:hypothetical protein PRIC1_006452 [Phytophthora ramorum]|uniref:Cleavage and polyadenylation specificity factor subunit 4 n=1 Tax=Phytophthora ramorum TaxID=164328 RepID=UPI00309D7227|nr:Cleavage and polyadenylation specificity factor subunit 4 [Phytophthora ramorum]